MLTRRQGRGALSNPDGRFESRRYEAVDDGWYDEDVPARIPTTLSRDSSKTAITYNTSPDVPFDRSINPYRGCEHGCVYCFARPTHAYWGLSAGLDFETRLFYKPDVARQLEHELQGRKYTCAPIALGVNTDAYQPVEAQLGLTRSILEVLSKFNHPATVVTKSHLVLRDLDLLRSLADRNLIAVNVSVTSLDNQLKRTLEPRAASPQRRLDTIKRLRDAGVPTGVMVAPIIPGLNDTELETILEEARRAGASSAAFVLLRLPHEVKGLFEEWLHANVPLKAQRILSLIRSTRGGALYTSRFGERMRGTGAYADLIRQRFEKACTALELNAHTQGLATDRFTVPSSACQLDLF